MGWRREKLWQGFEPSGVEGKRPLVIVLHGYKGSGESVRHVVSVARSTRETADFWVPVMPHTSVRNTFGLGPTVCMLEQKLDEIWCSDYDELVIIGHSTGAPLARALYVAGRRADKPWADLLLENGRIVMLAGMNRGWKITHHLSLMRAVGWRLAATFGHTLALVGRRLTLFDLRRGSEFLTRMRFDWLALAQHTGRTPLTVQLLGTIDDLVPPEDSIDLVTGASFRYLDVEHSGHVNVLEMGESDRPRLRQRLRRLLEKAFAEDPAALEAERREVRAGRARMLQVALGDESAIAREEVRPWGVQEAGESELRRRERIEHVVFVVHGIRDRGFWTDKLARHIWKQASPAERDRLERVTSSYGYFGMGPFLFPWVRREKVEWLADQVLEAKARFPNARFSFVGHSNGTYLLAEALRAYGRIESLEFDRVVFAGSVVDRHYDWSSVVPTKVRRVLNIKATRDAVVAFFPQFFELVPVQDLGSAGHNGFEPSALVQNYEFAVGGHSAGREERFWDPIAEFVLGREGALPPGSPARPKLGKPGLALRFLGVLTPLPMWLILLLLLAVGAPLAIVEGWPWLAGLLGAPVVGAALAALALVVLLAGAVYAARRVRRARAGVLRPVGAFLVTIAVPLALVGAVWVAARAVGLSLPELTAWTPGVLVVYLFSLLGVLKSV